MEETVGESAFTKASKVLEVFAQDHYPYLTRNGTFKSVLSKRDFAKRYKEGEFGNASPTWDTINEFLEADYRGGLIHLRNRIAGGLTWYDVGPNDIDIFWQEAMLSGLKPEDLYISAMAPTSKTMLQGEIMQSEDGGLNLFYSTIKKPMRDALKEWSRTVKGVEAQRLLEYYTDPGSYDWIQVLLARYPDHVIEFSSYSVNWGTVPHRNTVIWEIRKY